MTDEKKPDETEDKAAQTEADEAKASDATENEATEPASDKADAAKPAEPVKTAPAPTYGTSSGSARLDGAGQAEPKGAGLNLGRLLTWLVVAAILLVVGVGVAQLIPKPKKSEEVAGQSVPVDLDARLTKLEKEVEGLQKPLHLGQILADISKLQTRVMQLEGRTKEGGVAASAEVAGEDFEAMMNSFTELSDRVTSIEDTLKSATLGGNGEPVDVRQLFAKEFADLDTRIAELEKVDVPADLEQQLSEMAPLSAVETMKADLDNRPTKGDLESVSESLGDLAPREDLSNLEQRVVLLESNRTAEQARQAVIAMATAELTQKVGSNSSFVGELHALRSLMPDDPAIGALEEYADQQVPTRATLMAQYSSIATQIAQSVSSRGGSGDGDDQSVWTRIKSLFVIRRIDGAKAGTVDAYLADAGTLIADGKLFEAGHEIAKVDEQIGLSGAPKDWLEAVMAREQIAQHLQDLSKRVMQPLGQSGGEPAAGGDK